MQLSDESMINLALDLLLSDDEARQSVISSLLHALHGIKLVSLISIRLQSLDEVDFCVGALS